MKLYRGISGTTPATSSKVNQIDFSALPAINMAPGDVGRWREGGVQCRATPPRPYVSEDRPIIQLNGRPYQNNITCPCER